MHPAPRRLKLLGHPIIKLPQRWNGPDLANEWRWKEARASSFLVSRLGGLVGLLMGSGILGGEQRRGREFFSGC